MPPGKFATPSKQLTDRLGAALDRHGIQYAIGPTWTLDALYRETLDEIKRYQSEGILTVEMEAAALFAVAEYRDIEIAAAFAISDRLSALKWEPNFHTDMLRVSLKKMYDAALELLRNKQ